MEFEYDPGKSAANLRKHGIDFKHAQILWYGRIVRFPTYPGTDEERYMVLGMIGGKHWTAIVTYRGDRIRIISVRRSRKREEELYDQHSKGR
ncbi:BrnT family toxin [Bifidobacterium sp. 82T24]|uniref:BrnT family toxin n=1 Tax=Bifidobacterium pluvialisilvae TaxID=2834436 RepID=UPI001C57CCCC|nr:BrnT family toxin [Bifidobacterium pluvialisilvae]MBW3088530.1 BrnT family toxin [Bifidobacterium pluvialisilvae]